MQLSPFRIFIVFVTFLSACSRADIKTVSVHKLKLEPELQTESWGAPEHTHADFVSAMASFECPKEEDGVKYIDPLPKLIELARERNVVMINEAHYKPIHRAFIGELAKGLKTVGYDFYGAETFAVSQFSKKNRNSELSSRGYPVLSDGVYTEEPIFGQLIETLIDNEYQLFSYESTTPLPPDARSSIAHRDSEQASNIISEIGNFRDKKPLFMRDMITFVKTCIIGVRNGWPNISKNKVASTHSQLVKPTAIVKVRMSQVFSVMLCLWTRKKNLFHLRPMMSSSFPQKRLNIKKGQFGLILYQGVIL